MTFSSFIIFFVLACSSLVAAFDESEWKTSPHSKIWNHVGVARTVSPSFSSRSVSLLIMLHSKHDLQQSSLSLSTILDRVSSPSSSLYGRYLDDDAMTDLLQADDDTIAQLTAFIHQKINTNANANANTATATATVNDASTMVQVMKMKNAIRVTLTVADMENFIQSNIHLYTKTGTGAADNDKSAITALVSECKDINHIIPDNLKASINYVSGVTSFPPIPSNRPARLVPPIHLAPSSSSSSSSSSSANSPRWFTQDELFDNLDTITSASVNVDGDVNINGNLGAGAGAGTDDSSFIYGAGGKLVAHLLVGIVCPNRTPAQANIYTRQFTCGTQQLTSITYTATTNLLTSGSLTGSVSLENSPLSLAGRLYLIRVDIPLPYNYIPFSFSFTQVWSGQPVTLVYPFTISGSELYRTSHLTSFYQFPTQLSSSSSVSQAIGAFTVTGGSGYFSRQDLRAFYNANGVPVSNADKVSVQGETNDESDPDGETSLDIQWITGIAPGVTTTVFHAPASSSTPFEDVLLMLQNIPLSQRPSVISFSYGADEQSYVALAPDAVSMINQLIQALSAQGMTVLASSGDSGSHNAQLAAPCLKFRPSFPASSPYVTAVGATQLVASYFQNKTDYCPTEIACSYRTGALITSGGGFSATFPQQSYQQSAVSGYTSSACASSLPTSTPYNASNRAYPDLSLFGHSYGIYVSGVYEPVDGTSASSPALAGFLTLINQARVRAGQPTLGYFNPLLYALVKDHPEAMNDIKVGDNKCLQYGVQPSCCSDGFSACTGYDAVTGLGTPNFLVLTSLLVNGGLGNVSNSAFGAIEGCGIPTSSWSPPPYSYDDGSSSSSIAVTVVLVFAAVLAVAVVLFFTCSYIKNKRRQGRQQSDALLVHQYGVPVGSRPGFIPGGPNEGTYARLPGDGPARV